MTTHATHKPTQPQTAQMTQFGSASVRLMPPQTQFQMMAALAGRRDFGATRPTAPAYNDRSAGRDQAA